MKTRLLAASLALAAVLAGCVGGATDPDPDHGRDAAPSNPTTASGYAPLLESPVRGLTPKQVEDLLNGAGAGLALPAELNGLPGPKHVLEFADKLDLNATQKAAVERLYAAMRADAIRVGENLLQLHKNLDDGFRNRTLDEHELAVLLDAIAEKEAELRLVHLRTHLVTEPLLTRHQNALYQELRGYGAADHASHEHGG